MSILQTRKNVLDSVMILDIF